MSFEGNPQNVGSWSSALAIANNKFVMLDAASGTRNVKLATAGAKILGVTISSTPGTNLNVSVAQGGQVWVTGNGNSQSITADDRVKAATGGVAVQAATDLDEFGGFSLESLSSDGVLILVDINDRGTLSAS